MSHTHARIADHLGRRDDKFFKTTLFSSDRLLLGMNCLEPGQTQPIHDHTGQDKFYLIHEGRGQFTIGTESFEAGPGEVVWAPAGVPHGVANAGPTRLSLVVGIAPGPRHSA